MPFCYFIDSKNVLENHATSGTANTPIDAAFIKPGATRVVNLIALSVIGKGAGLTALSGLDFRLEVYPTTASAGGTSITPSPTDDRAPAAAATSAFAATAAGTVTVGTGTLAFRGGAGCGASGPGGWVAENPDAAISLDGGANRSIDLFSASGTISLNYQARMKIQE